MADPNDWNRQIIEEFRANEGRVAAFEGATMVLLHTTGARSGEERITPLVCQRDGNRVFVFASYAGADHHPAWYHNLVANPEVTVEMGTETFAATATPLSGAERDEIYARQVAAAPMFGEYQEKTARTIPVVELVRR